MSCDIAVTSGGTYVRVNGSEKHERQVCLVWVAPTSDAQPPVPATI